MPLNFGNISVLAAPLAAIVLLIALTQFNATDAQTAGDYDTDDDRLIEINYLEQLNAIRWDLNGDGIADNAANADAYAAAFPGALNGMGCPAVGCAGYELMRDLDFSARSAYASRAINETWTKGAGWVGIGIGDYSSLHTSDGAFESAFEGNNHTIANLFSDYVKLNRRDHLLPAPGYAGLFGKNAGDIRRIGVIRVDISGDFGVGGLVGANYGGSIADSYATGKVAGNSQVGGLIGANYGGDVVDSYATSSVTGNSEVGGLIGAIYNDAIYRKGNVRGCYATGNVSGIYLIGGLVGTNNRSVTLSYATGSISGRPSSAGGLVGENYGSITSSYAAGKLSGDSNVGGLVGENYGSIAVSYATGNMSGNYALGGLAGVNGGVIVGSYAAGDVNGGDVVGGLIGNNYSAVRASYSIGKVRGKSFIGGIIGSNSAEISDIVWDTETSTTFIGVGSDDVDGDGKIRKDESATEGATGRKTEPLKRPTAYTDNYIDWNLDLDNADADFNQQTGKDEVWDFGDINEYPLLKVDFDGDGTATWWEFGAQHGRTAPTATPTPVPTPMRIGAPSAAPPSDTTPAADGNALRNLSEINDFIRMLQSLIAALDSRLTALEDASSAPTPTAIPSP